MEKMYRKEDAEEEEKTKVKSERVRVTDVPVFGWRKNEASPPFFTNEQKRFSSLSKRLNFVGEEEK